MSGSAAQAGGLDVWASSPARPVAPQRSAAQPSPGNHPFPPGFRGLGRAAAAAGGGEWAARTRTGLHGAPWAEKRHVPESCIHIGVLNAQTRRMRSLFTPKRRIAFLTAIGAGMSSGKAAEAIGVARRTVFNWRAADAGFRAEWDEAANLSTDRLEEKLYNLAESGNVTALIFMLPAAASPRSTIRTF